MLGRYIGVSAAIHLTLVGGLVLSSSGVSVDFDIRRGLSALRVEVKEKPRKKRRVRQQKPKQFTVIVSKGGSFFVDPGTRGMKSNPADETLKHRKKLGALYRKARLNSENFPPRYPYLAVRLGYHGSVRLAIEVLPSGRAGRVSVIKSSGRKMLDESALAAARRWIFFKPGEMKLKKPLTVHQDIEFRFNSNR